jgi:hypothetical protein
MAAPYDERDERGRCRADRPAPACFGQQDVLVQAPFAQPEQLLTPPVQSMQHRCCRTPFFVRPSQYGGVQASARVPGSSASMTALLALPILRSIGPP